LVIPFFSLFLARRHKAPVGLETRSSSSPDPSRP
jgi:hypothetical protein